MNAIVRPAARPFFLDTRQGERFCIYHAPSPGRSCAGAVLYVHPFGEEMNMSRRMAALQSRAFADAGYGVLQMDLFGCGDSEGDLCDASLDIWRQDLVDAAAWLRRHVSCDVTLWGLRLGAALALDATVRGIVGARKCILWQPVIAGRPYMRQFLRLALAADITTGKSRKTAESQDPHDALAQGKRVEVGGYVLPPALVNGIEEIDFTGLQASDVLLHWYELVPNEQAMMPPARMDIVRAWVQRNIDLRLHVVTGPAFWATAEISECPHLVSQTTHMAVEEPA